MRVLFLTTVLPRAARVGGDIGSQSFIEALQLAGADVSVIGYDRPGEVTPPVPWEICAGERVIESADSAARAALWYVQSVLARRAYSQQKYVGRRYVQELRAAFTAKPPSVVVIDHAQSAWILAHVPLEIPIVYIAANVESDLYAGQAATASGIVKRVAFRREARYMRQAEDSLIRRAAGIWAAGERDAETLRERYPGCNVTAFVTAGLPAVDVSRPIVEPVRDVGLLGTWSWASNRVGLEWFVREVVRRIPDGVSIEVAGSGADWLAEQAGIQYLGRVPSAERFLDESRVVALPTTAGSGIQIKTCNTIAAGAQIVATHNAIAGLPSIPPFVQVASSADDFACSLVAQLRTPTDARERRTAGWEWITGLKQNFNGTVAEQLLVAMEARARSAPRVEPAL
jgi:hypothetical protein